MTAVDRIKFVPRFLLLNRTETLAMQATGGGAQSGDDCISWVFERIIITRDIQGFRNYVQMRNHIIRL